MNTFVLYICLLFFSILNIIADTCTIYLVSLYKASINYLVLTIYFVFPKCNSEYSLLILIFYRSIYSILRIVSSSSKGIIYINTYSYFILSKSKFTIIILSIFIFIFLLNPSIRRGLTFIYIRLYF
jgi:hypothetical protein